MELVICKPRTAADFASYYDLRWRILREPWTQSKETARDEHEDAAVHVMAWDGDVLVGAGRLHFNSPFEGQIRYMAVETQTAGRGVGGAMLRELEACARAAGLRQIVLNARETAIPFYRKHGYSLSGKSKTLFGAIDHWYMTKKLDGGALPESC